MTDPTRDLLHVLSRQRFTPEHQERAEAICLKTPIDWEAFPLIAASEGVAPIVGVNLAACDAAKTGVPPAVSDQLQRALFENVAVKAQRRRELAGQLAALDGRGYDVMLLKSAGLEASGVYEHTWVTSARDVDLALRLRAHGNRAADDGAFRQALNDSGVENDHDPTGHHDLSLNGIVDLPFDEMWRAARLVRLDDVASAVYVMCPEDLLLTLCLNGCRKHFFRLKVLFDICETLARSRDFNWVYFAKRVRTVQAEGVVYTALRVADETLGLPAGLVHCYSTLLSKERASRLGSLIAAAHRSYGGRLTGVALQYASLNARQRWRSAKLTASGRLPRVTAAQRAEARLPGE